ncbi:sensor histidine kinase [Kurthia sibirica]|nr:HAMP domain-containing sensor histidine kinase [Kurthia sibirica]GEK32841.1 two-component sensor histidine kinase [Kurthia sibirica]
MDKVLKYIISLCATIVVLGSITFLFFQEDYLTTKYEESEELTNEVDDFIAKLGLYILDIPSEKEALKRLTVTATDIKEYREKYGSMEEQISSINYQYQDKIEEAKNSDFKKMYKVLIEERDSKMDKITRNFTDKKYVTAKVLALKQAGVKKFYRELPNTIENFEENTNYFSYDLTNNTTGNQFKKGEIDRQTVFKKEYGLNDKKVLKKNDTTAFIISDLASFYSMNNITEKSPFFNEGYSGTIAINKKAVMDEQNTLSAVNSFHKFTMMQNMLFGLWVASVIALIIGLLLLWFKRKCYRIYKTPIEIQLIVLIVLAITTIVCTLVILEQIRTDFTTQIITNLFFLMLSVWILLTFCMNLLVSIYYNLRDISTVWQRSLTKKMVSLVNHLMLNMPLFLKVVAYLIIIFLAGFGFFIMLSHSYNFGVFLFYWCLFIVIVMPTTYIFFKNLADLTKILKMTDQMVHNQSKEVIHINGDSALAKHAENLNHMRSGVEHSVSEQHKSERLKTELITNVSHDLRTPLTSIITYTELLKKDDLSDKERKEYVAVLDKKSQRLRALIDDLFEVSKMTTGNVELQKQQVDLAQLVQQAMGEHESEIEEALLRVHISIPDHAVMANIDGQKYWRVIDNLIGNAIKYSLEGTRIFATLQDEATYTELTIKNISKYEISEDVEELYERFKRADASRHTEGSGLGLAIAQSIVELHGGSMKITIDGDLFKVTVVQPKK